MTDTDWLPALATLLHRIAEHAPQPRDTEHMKSVLWSVMRRTGCSSSGQSVENMAAPRPPVGDEELRQAMYTMMLVPPEVRKMIDRDISGFAWGDDGLEPDCDRRVYGRQLRTLLRPAGSGKPRRGSGKTLPLQRGDEG